jgi:hypothetical protein
MPTFGDLTTDSDPRSLYSVEEMPESGFIGDAGLLPER